MLFYWYCNPAWSKIDALFRFHKDPFDYKHPNHLGAPGPKVTIFQEWNPFAIEYSLCIPSKKASRHGFPFYNAYYNICIDIMRTGIIKGRSNQGFQCMECRALNTQYILSEFQRWKIGILAHILSKKTSHLVHRARSYSPNNFRKPGFGLFPPEPGSLTLFGL